MGLYDPFTHLKHKLWPIDMSGIKLAIWFLTIKSRESPRFPFVQVACDILLESSWKGLEFYFNPHFNRRSIRKIMGPQSHGSPNFGNVIWMWASWSGTKYTIRGKVVASPKSGSWWVLWVRVCPWFILAPKVFQLCTNQLVVWFCVGPCEWLNVYHSS